ncbi:hypothetical protein [Nesterenkonia halotolerans]|uniref:Uncharacterized protein n=1 Tax=Nesterenkonia halotolerans TaxID=225325 RepID=A0ABR9J7V3_9MICC|nr:hypothetical protein [Nesterenkonia halotolerans]MBE1514661.1 hypothetical protein [Nesterenkonia halotolerans]
MNLLPAPPAARVQGSRPLSPRLRAALSMAAIAPLMLVGCAVEEEPSSSSSESPSPSSIDSEEAEPVETSAPDEESDTESESDDEDASGPAPDDELPDPDAMDMERTEELGAYFSEEEACLSVGSMVDGLRSDMNQGIEEQEILDEAYLAVEQTYVLVPDELRDPLKNILNLLNTEVENLDEEEVLVAAEPVEGWLTVEFCDGQYHNQNEGEAGAQD